MSGLCDDSNLPDVFDNLEDLPDRSPDYMPYDVNAQIQEQKERSKKKVLFRERAWDKYSRVIDPYLEESAEEKKIFTRWPKKINFVKLYNIESLSRIKQIEYCFFRKNFAQREEDVIENMKRFKKVVSFGSSKIRRVWYPIYYCEMTRGKQWQFTEADLPYIEYPVLFNIVFWLRNEPIRPRNTILGLNAIYRHLRTSLMWSYLVDFQLAIESWQCKMNVSKPRRLLSDFDSRGLYSVVYDDTKLHGVVYKDAKGEKKHMMFSEINLFCDGTIYLIRNGLNRRLRLGSAGHIDVDEDQRSCVESALEIIKNHLDWRENMRIAELILKIRIKYPSIRKNPNFQTSSQRGRLLD